MKATIKQVAKVISLFKGNTAQAEKFEMIKNHIPSPLRSEIEKGSADFASGTKMDNAVVGFVDIVSSTQLSNVFDLAADFEFKQAFLKIAAETARTHNIVILNHTGDGFMFLVNFNQASDWQKNLILFHKELVQGFQQLQENMIGTNGIETGIRMGVACGTIMLGCLGMCPTHYTAVGAVVNLAARMCATAQPNELAISEGAWDQMHSAPNALLTAHSQASRIHELKGFVGVFAAMHLALVA